MKSLLFLCTIYVLAYFSEGHLVVLEELTDDNQKLNSSNEEDNDGQSVENASAENEDEGGDEGSGAIDPGSGSEKQKDSNGIEEGSNENSSSDSSPEKTIMEILEIGKGNENDKENKIRNWMRWASEIAAGNPLSIIGANQHVHQPDAYPDLNRRFVLQYPYADAAPQVDQNIVVSPENNEIVPIEAPEEVVTLVAKESAKRVASQPQDSSADVFRKKILRTGEFWNGVWKEEVNPKIALRTGKEQALGVIKAKIMPGNELYDVVSKMKNLSPKLLYIINEKNNDKKK